MNEGTFNPEDMVFSNGDKPTGLWFMDYDDNGVLRKWYRATDSLGREYDTYEDPE